MGGMGLRSARQVDERAVFTLNDKTPPWGGIGLPVESVSMRPGKRAARIRLHVSVI